MSIKHRWLIIDDDNSAYRTSDKARVDVALEEGALALDLQEQELHYGPGAFEREPFEDLPDDIFTLPEEDEPEADSDED